jgi:hypothetical protein
MRWEEAREKLILANQVYISAMRAAVMAGDYKQAVWLSHYMEINLGITPVIRRERGGWLLKLGRFDEGMAELAAVLALLPDDLRAQALMKDGRSHSELMER